MVRICVLGMVFTAVASMGCGSTEIRVAPVPVTRGAANADLLEKTTGTIAYATLRDGVLSADHPWIGSHEGTLAQSGEGPLGDRLFREDEYGFVEGCHWAPKGHVCKLALLPDNSVLGGGVHWIIPADAKATPAASGWVAQGLFTRFQNVMDRDPKLGALWLSTVLIGRAYHCRFTNDEPRCLEVPVTRKEVGYVPLGTFSLQEGDVRREVLWIGIFGETAGVVLGNDAALAIKEVHRCETTENANGVDCKPVAMR